MLRYSNSSSSLTNPLREIGWWSVALAAYAWIGLWASATAENTSPRFGDARAYREQLESLARRCEQLGLPEQAAVTRAWWIRRDPSRLVLFLVSRADSLSPRDDAPVLVKQWYEKFMEYRRERAAALWNEATEAMAAGEGGRAYQLLHEILREDPDHQAARRILGFRRKGNTWTSSLDRLAVRPGRAVHPLFGWRRNRYWIVESEHFRITTNHSAKAGAELAHQMEDLFAVWSQLFFRCWTNKDALKAVWDGHGSLQLRRKKNEIILFRDRNEYLQQLRRIEPQISVSLGYYHKGRRMAFFYADGDDAVATRFHEATHQLFQEQGNAIASPGEEANFWVIEGIAVYMESLVRHDGYATLGGVEADRLQFARSRRLTGDFYMPLAELVQLGRNDLQQHELLSRVYTQSAGLAHFLMHYDRQRYRPALIEYVARVYKGEDTRDTLTQLTGTTAEEIDRTYARFLNVTDEQLSGIPVGTTIRNLALMRTAVTDKGLAHLSVADLSSLRWLDLSLTAVTDEGLAVFRSATQLKQLALESTHITDASLELIGQFDQIEELDLSHTSVTDDGVAHLGGLSRLTTLWLNGTAISDRSVAVLSQLPALEKLDLRGTRVSMEAVRRLCRQKSDLKIEFP